MSVTESAQVPFAGAQRAAADPRVGAPGDQVPAGAGAAAAAERHSALGDVVHVGMVVLAASALSIAVHLLVISGYQHRAAQQRAFDQLRKQLAEGTAPLGQTDQAGHLLALGTPVARIDIPAIGVHEVVLEGTTSGVLMSGPGHSRGSPLPGQAGTSVIFGRQASYGGPFSRIFQLPRGATVVVTTGEGASTFKVLGVRRAGNAAPPALAAGQGRLLLVTADGFPFVPSGVLRVDAALVTPPLPGSPAALPAGTPHAEQIMAGDTSTLWTLVLWLQALVVVSVGIVWSWARWGHHQTWIVFVPVTLLIGLFAANQFMKLLPNLL